MAAMSHWTLLALLALAACTQPLNPCPVGSNLDRVARRCIPALSTFDASAEDDGGPPDSGDTNPEAGSDAALDDAEVTDGRAPDSGADAAPEAGPCSDEDVEAWRAFHINDGAVEVMTSCIEQFCTEGTCYPKQCVKEAVGLVACDTCLDSESACVLEFCNSACGEPGSDPECRACTCESGCVSAFDQCAQVTLDVCNNVYGRDAPEDEFTLKGPWLLRMKGFTGLLQTGPMAGPQPPPWNDLYTSAHLSEGYTHAVPFRFRDRQFLLQHKSSCTADPCVARISPVLSDGTLGRPLYMDSWSRGWDELEVFELKGEPYLLRYKTGAIPSDVETKGHLRIEHLKFDAALESVALEPAFDLANAPITALTWSAFEPFQLGGESYLLRYSQVRGGEVELLRVDRQQNSLSLTPLTEMASWSRGWDLVEMFEHDGDAYVLTYRLQPSDSEPAATAKVLKSSHPPKALSTSPPFSRASGNLASPVFCRFDTLAMSTSSRTQPQRGTCRCVPWVRIPQPGTRTWRRARGRTNGPGPLTGTSSKSCKEASRNPL